MLPIDYAPAADPHDGLADAVNEPVWLEPYPDTSLGLEGLAGPDARYEQREASSSPSSPRCSTCPPGSGRC